MVEYGALEQCLREGFIDYTVEADQRYVPKILTNNKDSNFPHEKHELFP